MKNDEGKTPTEKEKYCPDCHGICPDGFGDLYCNTCKGEGVVLIKD